MVLSLSVQSLFIFTEYHLFILNSTDKLSFRGYKYRRAKHRSSKGDTEYINSQVMTCLTLNKYNLLDFV